MCCSPNNSLNRSGRNAFIMPVRFGVWKSDKVKRLGCRERQGCNIALELPLLWPLEPLQWSSSTCTSRSGLCCNASCSWSTWIRIIHKLEQSLNFEKSERCSCSSDWERLAVWNTVFLVKVARSKNINLASGWHWPLVFYTRGLFIPVHLKSLVLRKIL